MAHCPRCHGRLCRHSNVSHLLWHRIQRIPLCHSCHSYSTIFACLPFRSGISSSRASALGNNFAGSVHKISVPTPGTQPHQQRMLTKELYNVLHPFSTTCIKNYQNITKYVISRLLHSLSRREKRNCSAQGNLDSVLDNVLDTPPLYCSLGLETIGNIWKPHHVCRLMLLEGVIAHACKCLHYIPHRF